MQLATSRPSAWPAATFASGPERQEITFADGSSVWLHLDYCNGHAQTYTRRLGTSAASAEPMRFDLLRAAPDLAYSLPAPTTRDAAAAVFHSLRKRFGSAGEFRAAIGAPLLDTPKS